MHELFPHLAGEGYTETSPATSDYNCIAWAAGWRVLRYSEGVRAPCRPAG